MSQRIKDLIEKFISGKAENNPALVNIIKAKLILTGIDPNRLMEEAIDDPLIIAKLEKLAKELRTN